MAGWPYAYTLDGIVGLDYAEEIICVTEGMAAREGINFPIPGLHGEWSNPFKMFEGTNVVLFTSLRYTNAAGVITHANGSAGHVDENKAKFMEIFGKTSGPVTIQRVSPHPSGTPGTQSIEVELLGGAEAGDPMWHYLWALRAHKPFWKEVTAAPVYSSGTGTISRGGNAPVDDAIVTITTHPGRVTINATGEYVGTSSAASGTVVIDCGKRTIKVGSTHRDEWIEVNSEKWFSMEEVSVPVTVIGSVSIAWNRKHH